MKLKTILLSSWVRWLISLILLTLLLAISDVELIGSTMASAHWHWLFAGFMMAMLLTAYGGFKWWVLMPRSRVKPWVFVRVNFISNFVGIFFPGIVGIEAARIAGIAKSSSDLPAAFSSVLVDRVFGLVSLALTVLIGGIVAASVVPFAVTAGCAFALIALFLGGVALMNHQCRGLLARWLPRRIDHAMSRFYECMDLYRDSRARLVFSLALSMLFQQLRVVMVFFLALSLDVDVAFTFLIVVVPVALFVQMMPVSIYGIGIRESAMVFMLAIVGVSTEAAISLSILMLAVQIAGSFPGGVLFAMGQRLEPVSDSGPK